MVKVNPSVFRAYDIRGTADPTDQKPQPDLTPETVKLIAKGTATYLARTYGARNILVGRDNRLHSEKLQKAFIEGLLESGFDVIDGGLTTSPMIYFASCHYSPDSAVNITASHNPKQDNGIKIVQHHAHSVADQELQEIRKLVEAEDFLQPEKPGQLSTNTQIAADYLNKIVSTTTLNRPLKIVLDAGNGVAGPYAPAIFRALKTKDGQSACEVIELFCEPDGNFPNHEANPEHAKNMVDLGKKVVEVGADLGIGFDGDADRVGLVDEKGKHYTAEFPIMLIARHLLQTHPEEKIIHDVKVNQALIDDIKAHHGKPIMSRVGHSYIERRLHDEGATLAGEKSGHLFFGEKFFNYYGFDDGIFAGVKIVEALSHYDQPFSQIFADIPVRPAIPELKIPCPDERKHEVITTVTKYFQHLYDIAPENQMPFVDCITLDGVRLQFSDGAWILARYSNTSPYLTIHAEAPTETRLNEIKELVFDQLRPFPEVKLP
ncbi:phosphomannomutase/phosphoglucomutase [Candidatus Peregrinibacteria bacterium]|nr:phosphomannomutase/phosphoglucomutase [Candidatus Peregrinibacteria bacterium]